MMALIKRWPRGPPPDGVPPGTETQKNVFQTACIGAGLGFSSCLHPGSPFHGGRCCEWCQRKDLQNFNMHAHSPLLTQCHACRRRSGWVPVLVRVHAWVSAPSARGTHQSEVCVVPECAARAVGHRLQPLAQRRCGRCRTVYSHVAGTGMVCCGRCQMYVAGRLAVAGHAQAPGIVFRVRLQEVACVPGGGVRSTCMRPQPCVEHCRCSRPVALAEAAHAACDAPDGRVAVGA